MRKLLFVLLLLVALVIGVGWYRDWFNFATASDPGTGQTGIQLNIDQSKIKSDAQKARETVSGAAGQAKEPEGK